MDGVMIEFLTMCGLETTEAESELPRIERAFHKLGITAEDIKGGKRRLTAYYDTELKGVRKILRLSLRDLVNSVLAREDGKKKVLFGFMAPAFEIVSAVLATHSNEVLAAHQCWAPLLIIGCVFDKMVPILEAAERKWLKAGTVAHCSNVKSLVGLFTLNMLPKPDLLVTTGFSCETAPKTINVLHELYGIPVFCYDTCQDRSSNNYEVDSERTIGLVVKSTRKLVERIQEIVGFELTDDMFQEMLDARAELDNAVGKLRYLIENSDPLAISAPHDNLLMVLYGLTLSTNDSLPQAIDAINTLRDELQERVDKGVGVVEKRAPRILSMLPAHHSDPRLDHLIGELGMAIVACDPGFRAPYPGAVKDPYAMMSLHLQGSLASSLPRRVRLIIEGCKRLKIDGLLNRYHVGCRAVAGDPFIIADAVGKELGIPVLTLAWENFDPRVYNHEQYKRRLELFRMMLDTSRNRGTQ
jgi:benzoyl-CoA reductase/2-hydroxyglutaryl-CoA dehydratase subunit BcrC/BadD/HgdB